MSKIFVMAGEVSGDLLAAWYVRRCAKQQPEDQWFGVGGDAMQQEGVTLIDRLEQFNVVGVMQVVANMPRLIKKFFALVSYIRTQQIDQLVLVDFPGFNLLLAGYLRSRMPHLQIVYLSPPQLWCWGAWRVGKLRRVTDRVIVLYPFEVAWYAQHGIKAEWLGCPAAQRVVPFHVPAEKREPYLVVVPGSRTGEVLTLLPIFLATVRLLRHRHAALGVVIVRAPSISQELLRQIMRANGFGHDRHVRIISGQEEGYQAMAHACAALAKPGTVTLELGVLGVPTVIGFTTSWLTYLLARPLVRVKHMGLVNLLLKTPLVPEYIQSDCTPEKLSDALNVYVDAYMRQPVAYQKMVLDLEQIKELLT